MVHGNRKLFQIRQRLIEHKLPEIILVIAEYRPLRVWSIREYIVWVLLLGITFVSRPFLAKRSFTVLPEHLCDASLGRASNWFHYSRKHSDLFWPNFIRSAFNHYLLELPWVREGWGIGYACKFLVVGILFPVFSWLSWEVPEMDGMNCLNKNPQRWTCQTRLPKHTIAYLLLSILQV